MDTTPPGESAGNKPAHAIRFYTVPETAELLKVHANTVYGLIKAGSLKATNIGRSIRVPDWALVEMSRELAA